MNQHQRISPFCEMAYSMTPTTCICYEHGSWLLNQISWSSIASYTPYNICWVFAQNTSLIVTDVYLYVIMLQSLEYPMFIPYFTLNHEESGMYRYMWEIPTSVHVAQIAAIKPTNQRPDHHHHHHHHQWWWLNMIDSHMMCDVKVVQLSGATKLSCSIYHVINHCSSSKQ